MPHQDIGRIAQRRVRRDARIAVRPAALQRQHQFACRRRLAPCPVDHRQHRLHRLDAGLDGLFRPAHFLDGHGAERLVLGDPVGFLELGDLEALAAQPHHHHATHVRVGGIAPGGLLERVEDHATIIDDAAVRLLERDDAVDVGIVVEDPRALDLLDDEPGHRRRAVHRGQHAHIIACPHLPVRPLVALERRLLSAGEELHRHHALAERIVALERPVLLADAAIMLVHPLAGRNAVLGKADDLAELDRRLARADRSHREFVAARHALARHHPLRRLHPGIEIAERHRHIVLRVQQQRLGGRAGHDFGH